MLIVGDCIDTCCLTLSSVGFKKIASVHVRKKG